MLMEDLKLKTNLFNDKDFEFINTFNSDLEIVENKLKNQKAKKDLIISLIDKLNLFVDSSPNDYQKNKEEINKLINNIESIYKHINDNINLFLELKQTINLLNKRIVDLLKDIESNKNSEMYYIEKVKQVKDELNLYSIQMNNMKSRILLNEVQIDNFLKNSITLKYIEFFNLELINIPTENSSKINKKNSIYESSKVEKAPTLLISEKKNKVYLPYTESEINAYLTQYPNKYSSANEVINREFILPLSYYQRHPILSRFREAYSLIRDKEMKSFIEALKFASDLLFRYDLNPAIIAACKTQSQLEDYIDCLNHNELDLFSEFNIKFEINPI